MQKGIHNPKLLLLKLQRWRFKDQKAFDHWKASNVFGKNQNGYFAIGIKVFLGDFYLKEARALADLVETYAAAEIRLSLRAKIY